MDGYVLCLIFNIKFNIQYLIFTILFHLYFSITFRVMSLRLQIFILQIFFET